MISGYGGKYRGSVVDVDDPLMQGRLLVLVPEIYGTEPAWALPSLPPGDLDLGAVGSDVWVSFERGDPAYPVWEATAVADTDEPATSGYIGVYRGLVVDDGDPLQQNRLQVSVPEVAGETTMWATLGSALGGDVNLPPVGSEVWVEFERGDPGHPIWVGVR